MKNTMACLGVIALLAVIGFTSCSNGTTDEPEPELPKVIVHTYKSVKNEITYVLEIIQPVEEGTADDGGQSPEVNVTTPAAYTPAAGDTYKLTIIYPDGATVTSSGTIALSSTTSSTAIFSLSNGVNLKVTITKQGAMTVITGTINPDPVVASGPTQGGPDDMPPQQPSPITASGTVTSDGNGSPPAVNYAPTTVAVTGITLDTSSLSLTRSGTATLTATVNPSNATNKTITWTSSNTAVATVSDGTVTAVGTGSATITVTTKDGGKTATCNVTVRSSSGGSGGGGGSSGSTGTAPTVTTTTFPGGTVGTAYSQTLTATGTTPITWSIDTGTLPGGLNLSTTGTISGTPTTAGTSGFTVKATNTRGNGTKALSIVIAPGTPAKTVTSITAVYSSPTDIFPDTELDTLEEGLVVTAHYSDNSTASVTTYTLSGALTAGTSTITVTYTESGVTRTATFTVTVDTPHVHVWSAWTTVTPATCTTTGVERENCTADPPHYNERIIPINPTAHTWRNSYTVTTPATCSATGIETDTCSRNAAHTRTRTVAINLAAHNYNWTPVTAATCTTAGSDNGTCSYNATHTTTRTVAINPTAHVWNNNYTVTTPATCSATGIETDTCSLNVTHTRTQTIAINPTAHDWQPVSDTATETADGHEGRVCNNDHTHDELTPTHAKGTAGLAYEAIGTTAYRVREGSVIGGAVHIPAFHRADATSPYLPVTEIGAAGDAIYGGAFYNTAITSITIPASVTIIGNHAFRTCTSLTSVTFTPNSQLTTLGQYTFYSCTALTDITIPDGVTSIGEAAFQSCTSLASVTFEGTISSGGFNQYAFYQLGDLRAKYLAGGIGTYTVTSGTGSSQVWEKQ